MLLLWAGLLLLCVAGASLASRRAVTGALQISDSIDVSPALIGVTVLAIGTDLPEIANSIVSSASGHGDVNVGDSMGSVVTQITLVLGLLCFIGGDIRAERRVVISVGLAALVASVMVWILVRDGNLSHLDGGILILLWVAGTVLLGSGEVGTGVVTEGANGRLVADLITTIFWLATVGGMAIGVVRSFLELSDALGIPEFIGSFVALSIGTSLPELVVDWTAIRRGASSMAVGDIFGSSFVDATLSVGIGPLIFSSALSDDVSAGVAVAAIGVAVATVLVARTDRYDWRLGARLVALYAAVQIGATALQI